MSAVGRHPADPLIDAALRGGPRKCASAPAKSTDRADHSALTGAEIDNLLQKEQFESALSAARLASLSCRNLAAWFGVPKSTLDERRSPRRTDLAPLPEWFDQLREYDEWLRLNAKFARMA